MTGSVRLAAHQAGKKATSQADMMVNLNRAQRALLAMNTGDAEDKRSASAILSEYIEERGGNLGVSNANAQTKTSQSKASAATSSAAYSAADVGLAHGRGVAAERARVSAVFASQHSKGRERACAQLLSNTTRPAAEITDFLASEPLDKDRAATGSRESSQAAWDKANARIAAQNNHGRQAGVPDDAATPPGDPTASQARWDKANAKVGNR